MKLSRKELKRLIEAFVVDEQGNTVHIDKWYADNTLPNNKIPLPPLPLDHEYTDELIEKIDPLKLEDPKMARYIYDQYSKGDLESKKSAVEMAAAMGAITEEEANAAHTELDVKHHEDFLGIRKAAAKEGRDLFIDFVAELDAKRELFADHEDPSFKRGDKLTHMDEVAEKFLEKYPNEDWPTMEDFRQAGIEFYWNQPYIYGYRYRKPVPTKPSTALVLTNKPKSKPQPKPKKEKKPWWKFWENKNRANMKLSRNELRHLVEGFIADQYGRLRKVGPNPGDDYEHRIADEFMSRTTSQMDPSLKRKIDTLYTADPDSQGQGIELAGSLTGATDKEVGDAKFDARTAIGEEFDEFKDIEFNKGDIDLGLLKSFLNYLHKKGELVTTEKNKPYLTVYDVQEMFSQRYPGMGTYTDEFNFLNLGVEVYGDDFYIVGYDPEKFNI